MKNTIRISGVILVILSIFLIHSCKKDKTTPPVISTTAVTAISYTTATSGGDVTNEGGAPIASRSVCWNTSANPTITNSKTIEGGGGPFTSNITQLTPNTIYYVRAYATNTAGTGYGNQVSFTTLQVAAPVLTTTAITSVIQTTAVSGGNITADNGGSVTARGVCWSTSQSPTTANSKTTDATGTGSFTSSITGLAPGTTYYVRAYATNSVGTAYGTQVSFTTSDLPVKTINFVDDGTGYLQYYTNDVANCSASGGKGYFYINATDYTPFNSVETEVIKKSGSLYMYGIVFCYTGGNNYYRFLIDTYGYYEIFRTVSGVYSWYNFNTNSWQGNNSFSYPNSARLNIGYGVSNKIKVLATGSGKFDLYFNGTKDASFTDTNFTSGKTGFNAYVGTSSVESFPNTPVDVRFKEISAN